MQKTWLLIILATILRFSQGQTCSPGIPGCNQCANEPTVCTKCSSRYSLQSGTCQPCHDIRCSSCTIDPSICTLCDTYYGLVDNTCKKCQDSNCYLCKQNPKICTQCSSGYGFDQNKNCLKCSPPSCLTCLNNYKECESCSQNFGVAVDKNYTCSPCQDQLCRRCSYNYTKCTWCKVVGYGVGVNGRCEPCHQTGCLDCFDYSNLCFSCSSEAYIDQNGHCMKCPDSCTKCNNFTDCTSCKENTTLFIVTYSSGVVTMECGCFDFFRCQECIDQGHVCLKCQIGYGVDPSSPMNCSACKPEICSNCSQQNFQICLSCDDGLFMNENSQCEACLENCLLCKNRTSCDKCNGTLFFNKENLLCEQCPQNCTKCVWNNATNDVMCTECVDYFHIKDNQFLCTDICGDTLRFTLPCDFKLGIEYDGCIDNCQIEENFQCKVINGISESGNSTVNPFNEEMVCSYAKPLDLKIESIERERFVNKLKLSISVFPYLHVFSSISFGDLLSISHFFAVDSVHFNQKGNLLDIILNFNENVENEDFSIFFVPKEQNDIRFYATPQTTVAFKVNSLNFYSDFANGISRIIKPLCFVIVAFCWINAVFGLFTKKIAAVECFLCCQMAFEVFLWMQSSFYLPFEETQPLQYLSMFHISLSPYAAERVLQSASVVSYSDHLSLEAPHISKYDLSFSLMNSFIVQLMIQVIILLLFFGFILIVNFLRDKTRKLIEEKGDNFYSDQYDTSQFASTKKKLIVMEKLKDISAQVLLFFVTINITPFINATVFLFKYSHNAVEVEELLVLSVGAVTFLCTLFLFYFDPDPFDFYRYAFRRQWFTLPFFWFVLCALAATDVLIALLPQSSWAAVLPFGCVFLYVLICRPFKDLKENYRSAATFLVTVFVLCFRVFVQYFPQNLNNEFTYAYFFVIHIVLLILCFLTTVFIIYKFVYVNYILPGIKRYDKKRIMEEIDFVNVKEKMVRNRNSESVFNKMLHHQMSILNFSNEMRTLAFEKEIGEFAHTERKNMNLLRNDIISLNWNKEQHLNSRKLRQQIKLKQMTKIRDTKQQNQFEIKDYEIFDIEMHSFQRKLEKIQENIKVNLQQYEKYKEKSFQESMDESSDSQHKQKNNINFVLQLAVEENSFIRLKNAEQYFNEKKVERVRDHQDYEKQYDNILTLHRKQTDDFQDEQNAEDKN